MDERVTVEARFEPDGVIIPLAFIWRDHRHQISDLGRQWETEDERHFLVMIPSREVYELAFLLPESSWRLRRTPEHFGSRGSHPS
jgi:hypothetical protein